MIKFFEKSREKRLLDNFFAYHIENFYDNFRKNNKKENNEIINEWNEEPRINLRALFDSTDEVRIYSKIKLLLESSNLPGIKTYVDEVLKLIHTCVIDREEKISPDRIIEIIYIMEETYKNDKELSDKLKYYNNIYKNILLYSGYESEKLLFDYFRAKLKIYQETGRKIIFTEDDILLKYCLGKFEIKSKPLLDCYMLYHNLKISTLNRLEMSRISKKIVDLTENMKISEQYSEALYNFEKSRLCYTWDRRLKDYVSGFGEKPLRILGILSVFNIILILLYLYLPEYFIFDGINYEEKILYRIGNFIYFSITTITTVGYGDITPFNIGAKIIVLIQQIIGFFMIGSFVTLYLKKSFRS